MPCQTNPQPTFRVSLSSHENSREKITPCSPTKRALARYMHEKDGFKLQDIGNELNIHRTTVSRNLKDVSVTGNPYLWAKPTKSGRPKRISDAVMTELINVIQMGQAQDGEDARLQNSVSGSIECWFEGKKKEEEALFDASEQAEEVGVG
ncbi:hypothetical protein K435DRAFT_806121 [Dendrothele bispora CBS 962.96]|uniref:Uncharacterized protein n=1 Tax=Dendrothele bispora (strain CBS 962.96) TaxID=1314807 RepID=A0A4S8L8U6_DENBC|nr:hypothetical protein K435DRAFT_806121 [Dendrothele bispora CBS 962.96]